MADTQQTRYAKLVNGTPRHAGDAILFNQPSRQGLHTIRPLEGISIVTGTAGFFPTRLESPHPAA